MRRQADLSEERPIAIFRVLRAERRIQQLVSLGGATVFFVVADVVKVQGLVIRFLSGQYDGGWKGGQRREKSTSKGWERERASGRRNRGGLVMMMMMMMMIIIMSKLTS